MSVEPPGTRPPEWLQPLVDAAVLARSSDLGRWAAVPPDGARSAAVLVLFARGSVGPDLLLIERSEALRNHAGQPAFPGGAADPTDGGPTGTALREAAEEVGLDPSGVTVVALLPEMYLPPTGFVVTPVIGWWHAPSAVGVADPVEVARVERVPVAELADPANRFRVSHPSGFVGPAFAVRGMTVWGFTAGLIDWLLMLGGWALPWNADDIRQLPRRAVELASRGRAAREAQPPVERPAPADDTVAPYEPVTPYQPITPYDPGSRG
jgi:8-oxo-dGTP pyrophosphatase MutT (NUDIX family)